MVETIPMSEWYMIETRKRRDNQEQQETPRSAATEDQLTVPDNRVCGMDRSQSHRPRSSSDIAKGQNSGKNRTSNAIERLGDKLFCVNRLLENKTREVTRELTYLEEFIRSTVELEGTLDQAFGLEKKNSNPSKGK